MNTYLKPIAKMLVLVATLTGLAACGEDLEKSDYNRPGMSGKNLPTVTAGTLVENIGTQVTVEWQVDVPEGAVLKEAGIIVSRSTDFELSDPDNIMGKATLDESGKAEASVTGLDINTDYAYRTYAFTEAGIAYGEIRPFTTVAMERRTDFVGDFTDIAILDAFTTVALLGDEGGEAPSWQNLSAFSLRQLGIISSIFDSELLFSSGTGSLVGDVDNLITYEADFSGKQGVEVTVEFLRLSYLFGTDQTAPFEVYVSEQPITDAAGLAAATQVGSAALTPNDVFGEYSFSIPRAFCKPCYVTVRAQSDRSNYGLVLTGWATSSMHPVED